MRHCCIYTYSQQSLDKGIVNLFESISETSTTNNRARTQSEYRETRKNKVESFFLLSPPISISFSFFLLFPILLERIVNHLLERAVCIPRLLKLFPFLRITFYSKTLKWILCVVYVGGVSHAGWCPVPRMLCA